MFQALLKRILDVSLACILILAVAPVLLCVFVIQAIQLEGFFFTQVRAGKNGIPFQIFKLKTMRDGEAEDLDRVTWLGIWLRKTSLDEVPQLINVIKGDMSLVGPRPLPVLYTDRYTVRQRKRLLARPGLTGLAQIKGGNKLSWNQKIALDLIYLKRMNIVFDLMIILATPLFLIQRLCFYQGEHLQAKEFKGYSKRIHV